MDLKTHGIKFNLEDTQFDAPAARNHMSQPNTLDGNHTLKLSDCSLPSQKVFIGEEKLKECSQIKEGSGEPELNQKNAIFEEINDTKSLPQHRVRQKKIKPTKIKREFEKFLRIGLVNANLQHVFFGNQLQKIYEDIPNRIFIRLVKRIKSSKQLSSIANIT